MSNMSYCRFENTLRDMRDCLAAIENAGGIENYVREEYPSDYEIGAIRSMGEVAKELAEWLEGAGDISRPPEEEE